MYAIKKTKSTNQLKNPQKTKMKKKKKKNPSRTQPSPPQQLARRRRVEFQDTQSGKSWCM